MIGEKDPGPNTTTITVPTTTTTIVNTTTQTTSPITTTSPTAAVTINVTWTFDSETSVTNVYMVVRNLKSSQWAAIGLGSHQAMVNKKN